MKVNPLGIQSYQHLTWQEKPPATPANSEAAQAKAENVVIEPQSEFKTSALAVKAPSGSYADFLSEDERRALDLLFARFRETGRFDPGYSAGDKTNLDEQTLGRVIDVKV